MSPTLAQATAKELKIRALHLASRRKREGIRPQDLLEWRAAMLITRQNLRIARLEQELGRRYLLQKFGEIDG